MRRIILASLILFAGSESYGKGGMIGGGDVQFKSVMTCSAQSIDPTFPGSPKLSVAKEVDADGIFIPGATLRVVTLDAQQEPVNYYVTHDAEIVLAPDSGVELTIWQYDIGTTENKIIGKFTWNAASGTGALSPAAGANDVEELIVSGCVVAP